MNLRTMAFAAAALIACGTRAVSFAQSAPGPQGTPPPPPVPNATSSPLISTSPEPTPLPSTPAQPSSPAMTPTPEPFASPSASSSPEGRGRRGRRGPSEAAPSPSPSPTDTPEPPQFSTLDGVWEVALQPLNGARTVYSHLYVTQTGNTLTGLWRRSGKAALPFSGTFDGRLFKLTVSGGTSAQLLSGYEENFMDMVGLYTDGDTKQPGTPFTAAHRKRDKDRDVKPK